jgi:hypothetical protein
MEKTYNYGGDYYKEENSFNQTEYGMETTLYPELIILTIASYASCMIWKICKKCDGNNNNDNNNYNDITLLPDKSKINKKLIKYTDEMSDKECSICLEEFKKDEKLMKIECHHYFHRKCIDDWFNINITCPLCRLGLV